jgi:hypothetical protein
MIEIRVSNSVTSKGKGLKDRISGHGRRNMADTMASTTYVKFCCKLREYHDCLKSSVFSLAWMLLEFAQSLGMVVTAVDHHVSQMRGFFSSRASGLLWGTSQKGSVLLWV